MRFPKPKGERHGEAVPAETMYADPKQAMKIRAARPPDVQGAGSSLAAFANQPGLAPLQRGEAPARAERGEVVLELGLGLLEMHPAFVVDGDQPCLGKRLRRLERILAAIVMRKRPRGSAAPVNSTTMRGEQRRATSAVP